MRVPEWRLRTDIRYFGTNTFIENCKIKPTHFTRKRKMPLQDLLLSILNRKGMTLFMELRRFQKLLKKDYTISKAGYLKQRMKLKPKAFLDVSDFHVTNFYNQAGYVKKKNGYLILAADGSGINVPTTTETLGVYGSSSRKGAKPQASLGLSCLYDVLNKMILDCTINTCKFNEAKQAELHLEKIPSMIGTRKYLVVMDRGYPSTPLFIKMIDKKQKFLIRLKANDFKKEKSQMKTVDEDVTIQFTKSRIHHYIGTDMEKIMNDKKSITLRFVRIELPNGITEYLVTNLKKEEFCTEEIGQLYAMRWGIETAFDVLKNKLEIENFVGTKPLLIEQDIYSCVYLCNLIQDIIMDAEEEMKEELQGKYKHRMMINRSLAIGILRDELIRIIFEDNIKEKERLFDKIIAEIKGNLVPIRSGRSYKRSKGLLAAKYSNTHKRSY